MFVGAMTALVTPMRGPEVDREALERLVESQIQAGIDALVPCGTTGESATLSHEEHTEVIRVVVKAARKRVPVIAGAGSNSTEEAIELVRHAKAIGADAALVVAPYYVRPSQEGLYAHYAAINAAVQMPVLVYNVPSRTGCDVSNEVLARLARLPNIVGIKDATGDLSRASMQRLMCGDDWVMLSGDDPTGLGYLAHGGHGCISVTSNVAPEQTSAFYNAALAGDWASALQHQDRLIRLHRALFTDASPAPTKFALAHLGLCTEDVRLPLVAASEASRQEVLAAMRDAGVI
jgi:4-hydroxy-tetrahydrodipicolinate synthase